MKKADFIALGVPEDRAKEASQVWHDELRKLVAVAAEKDCKTATTLREAIFALLPTIKSVTELRRILRAASTAYYVEDKERRKRDVEKKSGDE